MDDDDIIDIPVREGSPKPIRIRIGTNEQVFTIRPYSTWTVLKIQQMTDQAQAGAFAMNLLPKSMEPEEFAALEALLDDPSSGVDLNTIVKMFEAVVERSSDFPTEPPSSSADGRLQMKHGSAATASLADKSRKRSA